MLVTKKKIIIHVWWKIMIKRIWKASRKRSCILKIKNLTQCIFKNCKRNVFGRTWVLLLRGIIFCQSLLTIWSNSGLTMSLSCRNRKEFLFIKKNSEKYILEWKWKYELLEVNNALIFLIIYSSIYSLRLIMHLQCKFFIHTSI
jgi:hypothetical protein